MSFFSVASEASPRCSRIFGLKSFEVATGLDLAFLARGRFPHDASGLVVVLDLAGAAETGHIGVGGRVRELAVVHLFLAQARARSGGFEEVAVGHGGVSLRLSWHRGGGGCT